MLNQKITRFNLTPWFLFLVFVGPFIAANTLYFFRDELIFKTLETGKLLSPPMQVENLPFFQSQFEGRWQLIYAKPAVCNAVCHKVSENAKKIQLSLGKDSHRFAYYSIPAKKIHLLKPGEMGIIDPKGWLILHYAPTTNPEGILRDLRRLLRYSHVG